VEPGKPDALAAALSGALSVPNRLRTMGEESRRIVESEFTWPIVVGRHLELYRELVA
jgi:glycosyltransferase involved in cell wall biosynthesis